MKPKIKKMNFRKIRKLQTNKGSIEEIRSMILVVRRDKITQWLHSILLQTVEQQLIFGTIYIATEYTN